MSLKIKRDRSNIIDDTNDDFIGNWKFHADEELTKLMAKQIQDSINIEIMRTLIDSGTYIDSHYKNIIFDSYNHPMYRPELTVNLKMNK